jgi:hypothetical protein
MLRYVVSLDSEQTQNLPADLHYFETFGQAEQFSKQNSSRFIECFSEERIEEKGFQYWKRHATYNMYI